MMRLLRVSRAGDSVIVVQQILEIGAAVSESLCKRRSQCKTLSTLLVHAASQRSRDTVAEEEMVVDLSFRLGA